MATLKLARCGRTDDDFDKDCHILACESTTGAASFLQGSPHQGGVAGQTLSRDRCKQKRLGFAGKYLFSGSLQHSLVDGTAEASGVAALTTALHFTLLFRRYLQ